MVHIGEKIHERIIELGMSSKVFASRINRTRNVVYDIFRRESIDSAQLLVISKVLDYDFFEFYRAELQGVKKPTIAQASEDILSGYDKRNHELLLKINQTLEELKAKDGNHK